MSSSDKPSDPMPIPAHRRNTFTGWPGTFFTPMATARPNGTMGMSPSSGMPSGSTAHSFSGQPAMASSPPSDQAMSAFSGIGLFRRFSASAASGGPPPSQPLQHPVDQAQHLHEAFPASDFGFHKDQHPRSKILSEVREHDDPPSRPDSRMRNLMLSGQFMI
ncbi:hypothetical protein EC988_004316 [Linderina pennispora]|nr:hypothetical protein EC988_004316 [Linderina pennispora]